MPELTLPLDGCEVRYWDSGGAGVPVVFSHGAGTDHAHLVSQDAPGAVTEAIVAFLQSVSSLPER